MKEEKLRDKAELHKAKVKVRLVREIEMIIPIEIDTYQTVEDAFNTCPKEDLIEFAYFEMADAVNDGKISDGYSFEFCGSEKVESVKQMPTDWDDDIRVFNNYGDITAVDLLADYCVGGFPRYDPPDNCDEDEYDERHEKAIELFSEKSNALSKQIKKEFQDIKKEGVEL